MSKFKNKVVNRDDEINTLIEIIENFEYYKENSENGLSILLNGSWGSGKTTFVHQFYDKLDKKNFIKFGIYDAFEYDFCDDPFIPLLSYISSNLELDINLENIFKFTGKQIVKDVGVVALSVTKSILKNKIGIEESEIEKIKDNLKNDYNELNSIYSDFKIFNDAKKDIKAKLKSKLENKKGILIIDELDRCNPSFALGTLEVIKYFLDIDNLIIILSLDKLQLQESVKCIYGSEINSDIYFSKFFDYQMNLRNISFYDAIDCSNIGNIDEILKIADNMFNSLKISIRDSKKIFSEFINKESKCEESFNLDECELILFLLILKNTNLLFYNQIMRGKYGEYYSILNQSNPSEYKLYGQILNEKLPLSHIPLNKKLMLLDNYANDLYIEKRYLNIYGITKYRNFEHLKNALSNLTDFVPRVLDDKTYLENLHDILD